MPAADLTQFKVAGNKWIGRHAGFTAKLAAGPEAFFREKAFLVSDRKMRSIAVIPIDENNRAHVKKYKAAGLIPKLRLLLGVSQADREFANLLAARRAGLPVPEFVCFGRHGGCAYLATVLIPSARPIIEILRKDPDALDNALVVDLADLTARAHEAGLVHQDLHLGNILRDEAGRLYLVDLHRALFLRSVSDEEAAENLGQLDFSLSRVVGRKRRAAFIEEYLRVRAIKMDRGVFIDDVFAAGRAWGREHFMSRTRRCTRDSEAFAVERHRGMKVYRGRTFDAEVARAVREHNRILDENAGGVLKRGRRTRLTVMPDESGAGKICVKEYIGRGLFGLPELILRGSRGMRAWINANGLLARGIGTPEPLALAQRGGFLNRREYLLTRYEETAPPMDVCLRGRFEKIERGPALRAKREFMRAAGRMMARLHDAEIFHKDFKANNILVAGEVEKPRFLLLDLDRLRFDEPLTEDEREFNIACLNAAVGDFITMTDRLRAFKAYVGRDRLEQKDRDMIARIVRISIARDHFWRPLPRRGNAKGET